MAEMRAKNRGPHGNQEPPSPSHRLAAAKGPRIIQLPLINTSEILASTWKHLPSCEIGKTLPSLQIFDRVWLLSI
jgi:hypothetical protein